MKKSEIGKEAIDLACNGFGERGSITRAKWERFITYKLAKNHPTLLVRYGCEFLDKPDGLATEGESQ